MCLLSICIPTYEMNGLGVTFLEKSFNIFTNQTFKDFDVIISDHSINNCIKNLCDEYKGRLDIKYYKNEKQRGNSSANINNAIKVATGKLIKILFQDDFLFSKNSLEQIVNNFDLKSDYWLVTACTRSNNGIDLFGDFYPKYNHLIHLGYNTISSPSVLTIKNESPLLFDENLLWLMDCDFYKRYYYKFGPPKILSEINVVNRIGSHQVSNTLASLSIKAKETFYALKKLYVNN